MSPNQPHDEGGLRRRAEERLKSTAGELKSETVYQHQLHELPVHQIELEMQNEESQKNRAETAAVRYTDLYDFAPVSYFTLNSQGEIIQTNLAGSTLLEAERSTLQNKRFATFIAEADRPTFNTFLKQVFAKQPNPACEVSLERKDGQAVCVHINSTLSPDGQKCRTVVTDITEFKESQESLAQTAREWQITFNASNDGIWLLDKEHRIVRSNRQADRLFPSSAGDEGIRCWEVMHGTTGPIADCPVVRAKESLQRETMELPIGDRWYLVTADPVLDANGHYAGAVHVLCDITRRKQAEASLQASEEKFRALYDNAPLPYQSLDENGCFLDVNPAWLKTLGYERNVVIGNRYADFLHPDCKPHFEKIFPEFKRRGSVHDAQFKIRHKDGRYLDISLEGFIGSLPDGSFRQTYCVFQDITERKRAEEKLIASEKRSRAWLSNSTVCTKILDLEFNLQYMSDAGVKALNLDDATHLYGKPYPFSFYPDSFNKPMIQNLKKAKATGEIVTQEGVVLDVNGAELWFHSTIIPVKNDQGQTEYIMIISLDITERKQAEESLARQTSLLNETQQLTHVGGWQWNVEQQTIIWTDELYRIHGVSPDEFATGFLKQIKRSLECYDLEDRPTVQAAFDRCVAEGTPYDLELPFTAADGVRKWIRTTGRAVLEKDRVVRVLGNVLDITERLELESQLRQAQKMKAIGQLAGGVAHDFNNSLQIILGYTEVAFKHTNPSEKLHGELTKIQQAALHSAELTRQLLTLACKQIITPKTLNLNTTMESMLKILRRLVRENINLVWISKDSLWPIEMDPSQIEQILTNLSGNSRDAIDGTGEIRIKTANVTLDQVPSAETCPPGEYVQLSFSDDGCGMDEETLKHLFEPFFTTKEMHEGAGLGLATVYGSINQNHGFITVDSTLGKGTTFQIYLPRSADPEAEAEEKTPIPPSEDGHETILLVEDDELLLALGQQMLEALGYTVLAANLPDKALCLAEEHSGKFDLLLTDVIMPGMNGQELATHLQALRPSLKCLFMSGYTAEMLAIDNVLPAGVHFIPKPFSTRELDAKIREVLAGRPIKKEQNDD